MAGTYTKAIIVKNQNHIKNFFKGNGGMTGFVQMVDDYRRDVSWKGVASPYSAIAYIVTVANEFLWHDEKIIRYLHSLGLKDDKKIMKFKWSYRYAGDVYNEDGPMALYAALLARDGEKLYNDWVKKHPKRK